MPEACSALISTEADFDKICNFLFFCATSCLDQTEYELLAQALFELLKNYEYKWKLRLQHIFTVLENLGMNSDLLFDKDKVLSEALHTRLELVKRMNAVIGRKDRKLWPTKSHAFVTSRKKRDGDASEVSMVRVVQVKDRHKCCSTKMTEYARRREGKLSTYDLFRGLF